MPTIDKKLQCMVQSVKVWLASSPINLEEYRRLALKFERNKATITTLVSKIKPSKDFNNYCISTRMLFEAIVEVTGKNFIVDSSKTPQRIAVLDKIVNLEVLHLCRNAKGVLNSAKKSYKMDIEAGFETDFPARRTSKTLIDWFFVNLITEIFKIGVISRKIRYEAYLNDPEYIGSLHNKIRTPIITKGLSTDHMLAGNVLRLKKNIKIDGSLGFHYKRLSPLQFKIASTLDTLLPFWS